MRVSRALSFAAIFGSALAQTGPIQGFNYGNLKPDGSLKVLADYEAEFGAAKRLNGTNSRFTSARLYTTVQGGSAGTPNEAIQAAINTQTTLLLGLWCSAGDAVFSTELTALTNTLNQYGASLRPLLIGISVGSEDLYRNSALNQGTDPGADPSIIAGYIGRVRDVVNANPTFSGVPIGHVDTWNAFTNGTSAQVIAQSDFVGMNAFPYFQTADQNTPENNGALFAFALSETQRVSQGKPVWVTETGFPIYGPTYNLAVPGAAAAKTYYDTVGCAQLFGKINTWWYILLDGVNPPPANPTTPSFGVVEAPLKDTSIYDLSCPAPAASSQGTSTTSAAVLSDAPSPVATPSLSVASGIPFPLTSASTLITLPSPSASPSPSSPAATSPLNSSASRPSSPSQSASGSQSCPADLNGPFEFPHLLVPVSSNQPDTPLGTQYFGTIDASTSSIYNFDVNPNLAGRTCSLVFLFPRQDQLVFSSYNFNGQGGLSFQQLGGPADVGTSFSNVPAANGSSGAVGTAQPGSNYVVSSGPCPAGDTVAYRVSATGGLSLNYFQDFNPAGPIGLFLRAC